MRSFDHYTFTPIPLDRCKFTPIPLVAATSNTEDPVQKRFPRQFVGRKVGNVAIQAESIIWTGPCEELSHQILGIKKKFKSDLNSFSIDLARMLCHCRHRYHKIRRQHQ